MQLGAGAVETLWVRNPLAGAVGLQAGTFSMGLQLAASFPQFASKVPDQLPAFRLLLPDLCQVYSCSCKVLGEAIILSLGCCQVWGEVWRACKGRNKVVGCCLQLAGEGCQTWVAPVSKGLQGLLGDFDDWHDSVEACLVGLMVETT